MSDISSKKNKNWWSEQFDSPNPVDVFGEARAPDFICVGTEKAGTTWLWARLLSHPGVGVAASKELRFFNVGRHIDTVHFSALKDFLENPRQSKTNPHFLERVATEIRLFYGGTDAYLRIFGQLDEPVVGEISPQYCIQSPERVAEMQRVAPNARIIYMMRDPVDRMVSGGRMVIRRVNDARDEENLWEACTHNMQKRFSNAAYHIEKFENAFGADQVGVFFFDDIRDRPGEMFSEICDFIGAAEHTHSEEELRHEINKGPSFAPSDAFKRRLYSEVAHVYDLLEPRFPERVAAWRAQYE